MTIADFAAADFENHISEVPFPDTILYGFVEHYAVLNCLYSQQVLGNGNIENLYTQYAVDLTSGQIREITLSNYYTATQLPLDILAQFPGHLLVHAVVKDIPDEHLRYMGILTVEDWLDSQGNYRMIDLQQVRNTPAAGNIPDHEG